MQCRYLNRVHAGVQSLREQTEGGPICLLAHSAGGWLARVYLLGFGTEGIDRLVTLGSPHQPPPKVCLACQLCGLFMKSSFACWPMARVYLLGFGTEGIDRLVTLGSPHQRPPKARLSRAVWSNLATGRECRIGAF